MIKNSRVKSKTSLRNEITLIVLLRNIDSSIKKSFQAKCKFLLKVYDEMKFDNSLYMTLLTLAGTLRFL